MRDTNCRANIYVVIGIVTFKRPVRFLLIEYLMLFLASKLQIEKMSVFHKLTLVVFTILGMTDECMTYDL